MQELRILICIKHSPRTYTGIIGTDHLLITRAVRVTLGKAFSNQEIGTP
jgi:hypothetical protein